MSHVKNYDFFFIFGTISFINQPHTDSIRHLTSFKNWFLCLQRFTLRFPYFSHCFIMMFFRPIAQIEGLGLLYKNQVSLSWNRSKNRSKIGLKVCHHPQNSNSIWKIFLNWPRIDRFGPERLYLIILRNYRPFFANLGRNE